MEALYQQTNKLVQDVGRELGRLERTREDAAPKVESEVQAQLGHIVSNYERLDILVSKEPVTRRANAKMRVDQLKYDCQQVQAALRNLQHKRYLRAQEEQERDALLSRNFTTNEATSIPMDPGLQQYSRVTEAHWRMDDLLDSGASILRSLRDQRGALKGVHRKVLDMAHMLGLSGMVMRLVERRTSLDRIILGVGMVVTCVLMYLVWCYFT